MTTAAPPLMASSLRRGQVCLVPNVLHFVQHKFQNTYNLKGQKINTFSTGLCYLYIYIKKLGEIIWSHLVYEQSSRTRYRRKDRKKC